MKEREHMNLSTLFVISFIDFMLALVLVCIIATVVVNGRVSRDQQTPVKRGAGC